MWSDKNFEELPFLVVEDSADDLFLLQRALRKSQITNPHVTVCTGVEAIDYLERSSGGHDSENPFPVVIFLDLLLPCVSGLDVLTWLRDHAHPPVPVVLHTGVEDESLLQKARDLGARYYLPKGARAEAIAEVFRRARHEWERHHAFAH